MLATQTTLTSALLALSALIPACGDPPVRVEEPSGPYFQGEIALTGALAEAQKGFVFISARPKGTRVPVLSKRHHVAEFAQRAADGTRVLHYELTEKDFMGGVEVGVPENFELQIKFDPDGLVETFDGVEEVVVPVISGETTYSVRLSPGMPAPGGPRSAFEAEAGAPSDIGSDE